MAVFLILAPCKGREAHTLSLQCKRRSLECEKLFPEETGSLPEELFPEERVPGWAHSSRELGSLDPASRSAPLLPLLCSTFYSFISDLSSSVLEDRQEGFLEGAVPDLGRRHA